MAKISGPAIPGDVSAKIPFDGAFSEEQSCEHQADRSCRERRDADRGVAESPLARAPESRSG
ncbi:MAG: hypothetical protein N2037_08435 [Acidimicrobiales bacterium]|nr:hypothetical protein [Acidimicrobiales bacterium]